MQKIKASKKGTEELHAVELKLCNIKGKEADVRVTAKANEVKGKTGIFAL